MVFTRAKKNRTGLRIVDHDDDGDDTLFSSCSFSLLLVLCNRVVLAGHVVATGAGVAVVD